MGEQRAVSTFVAEHDLDAPPEYRLLDLVSEVGEVTKNATESTDYGADPGRIDVDDDEVGDVLFALLAVADSLDVDAGEALERSLAKYEARIAADGSPASGE